MANIDYTNLISTAQGRLPGALDTLVQFELQSLMNDFFDESNVWVDPISLPIVGNVRDYEVESDYGTINRLMNVVDSNNLPVAATLLPPLNDSDTYIVRLAFVPTTTDTYTANISLVPDNSQAIEQSVPGWVWSRFRSGLLDGLLARMMTQQSKPYTNPALAQQHLKRFRAQISQAKREAMHQYNFRGQGWSFPQSFRSIAARRR